MVAEPRLLRREEVEELPINERICTSIALELWGLESGVQEVGNRGITRVFRGT